MISKPTPARMARLVAQWRGVGNRRRASLDAITFPDGLSGIGAASCRTRTGRVGEHSDADVRAGARGHGIGAPVIEIVLPGGERLHVGSGASTELVRAVVAALRARMLTLSPAVRIYLATGTTDLRRSIDGLAGAGAGAVQARSPVGPSVPLSQSARRPPQDPGVGSHGGSGSSISGSSKARLRGRRTTPDPPSRCAAPTRAAALGRRLAQTRRRRWYERVA